MKMKRGENRMAEKGNNHVPLPHNMYNGSGHTYTSKEREREREKN
jgi:hypothetical protein